ncbi:tRNA (guanosine(46)-N7)-methyltransferase TrmB [Candidatus Stoquefichus sp. SB1]|uniref:tRNA (guanosine(46)-N7)-methyltransferase TrmB n=1 Tax=Candidatus Stoquefichus sp. SB1 TaxID=1658109 RepID=UPI00067EC556|nr:tRNA (guanosine(46)-N7)-methyltransferase TrmB [Candidatus Stoquefichus sp. SB1]
MRLRNNPKANEILENHKEFVVLNTKDYKGKWHQLFANDHPIFIEIGMGKGDFIIENAKRYPDINFIGIEKFPSVLVGAIKKLDEEPQVLPNLKLMKEDALVLNDVFKENEVSRIYLNFSDPWPKKKHAKRRLTSEVFLPIYQNILNEDGELILKTDNRILFEYSLISFQHYGMDFVDVCLDLHHSEGYEDNIQTEYERKFSPFGPIYRIVTAFKGEK